jgi:uncharacterized protein (DUF2141 family)
MRSSTRLLGAAALLLLAACGDPSVHEFAPRTGVIRGTIVYPRGTARGNVVVTLFAEDRLPPPQGTSGPVNVVIVPRAAMFGDAAEGTPGDFSAAFTIPTVPPGRYQIRAFLDADDDFNPLYGLLAQPTAGDVGGGYVDPTTGAFRVVEVQANQVVRQDVLVSIGRELPVERPAFAHSSTTSFAVPFARPQTLVLESHPVRRAQVQMDPMRTAFLIQYADTDGDGAPDDVNGDHLPDVYPQVLLRRRPVAGEACQPTAEPACSVVVPLIVNPLPFADTLAERGFALTTTLELIVPPVSLRVQGSERTLQPGIPTGDYETIVISGTGQTWQVPNDLDRVQPEAVDPTQSVLVKMTAGPALPGGAIEGRVELRTEAEGDVYVFAFDQRSPPPPAGTGSPVALATVPRAALGEGGAGRSASFTLAGLREGTYLVAALLDADGDFSPLVTQIAQPSAGDVGVSQLAAVTVTEGARTSGVLVELDRPYPFERPAFRIVGSPALSRTAPTILELEAHAFPAAGVGAARFPVTLGTGDADGDNLSDLLPRVLLTRIADGFADPRAAPNDPATIVVPGIVDPLPYLAAFASGAPAVPTDRLRLIVPPLALRPDPATGSLVPFAPIPPGDYRVNVLTAFGQTWSVPNDLDLLFDRVGTPAEDVSQAGVVRVADGEVPGGVISGELSLVGVSPPEGDFTVVVLAFLESDPPPPAGFGRPRASALVRKPAFAGGTTAPYALAGLPSGRYLVRAFLDADDDFTPWFDILNQPDAGDIGGAHLGAGPRGPVPVAVVVDALAGPTTDVAVTLSRSLTVPVDRPVFEFAAAEPRLSVAAGPGRIALDARTTASSVLTAEGRFLIQWLDRDGDGVADDVNGDGRPDVSPIVVAERLDPEDPEGLRLATPRAAVFGIVDPTQLAGTGFPVFDPTATSSVAIVDRLEVILPPLAVDPARPVDPFPTPPGRYRVTLIASTGQTWTVPNELSRALGDPSAASQSVVLTVTE